MGGPAQSSWNLCLPQSKTTLAKHPYIMYSHFKLMIMKRFILLLTLSSYLLACTATAEKEQQAKASLQPEETVALTTNQQFYIDVHELGAGNVTAEAVAEVHIKDLAVQGKHQVKFHKYWVDEAQGLVYCLSEAKNPAAITQTHKEAHGLLPHKIYMVEEGLEAASIGGKKLFLDIHELGPGNVTAAAVADAHEKDLAAQGVYGVNFINYWVNEDRGTVMCLSEAHNSDAVIKTHRQAHGLIPASIAEVTQGE